MKNTPLSNLAAFGSADEKAQSPQEYLVFRIGGEEYGIRSHDVQELRGFDGITRIANAPDFMMGVINLRGAIVPVVDLRIKFGAREPSYDQFTVMMILKCAGKFIGMLADSVSDVICMESDGISPIPEMGSDTHADYLTGITAKDERLIVLLGAEALIREISASSAEIAA